MIVLFVNNSLGTVTAGGTTGPPASGALETWTVASGATLPAASTGTSTFHIADPALSSEKILVTNVTGTGPYTLSVTRGDEGTTPVVHAANFQVQQVVTAADLGALVQTSSVGAVSGVASLDGSGLVPLSQLPIATTALFLAGSGVPAGGLGLNSDAYWDYTGNDLYTKTAGVWTVVGGLGPTMTPAATIKSGAYIQGNYLLSTSAVMGNASLHLTPLVLATPCTISAIGTEFTVAGDAPSLFHMAIYGDDGTGYPGSLLLDGGSISTGTGNAGTVATGGTPGVYMNTGITALALLPGTYWVGGAVQGVTTTQPTMRTACFGMFGTATTAVPAAGAAEVCYAQGAVTTTLPASFVTLGGTNFSAVASVARIILKIQ